MSKKIKMPRFTDKSDIRLGFEVECYVREGKWDEFQRKMRTLVGVGIGDDGSIETPGDDCDDYDAYRTAELRTRPEPPRRAIKLLKEIFDCLHGRGGTNHSCGFHVNISSTNTSKMKRFDVKRFINSRLWQRMLKRFKRENNIYCYRLFDGNPPTKHQLEQGRTYELDEATIKVRDKYACVNTCHFRNGEGRRSRIEIRAMGNLRYHCRYKLIAYFVKEIISQFESACESPEVKPEVKTYSGEPVIA